MKTVEIQNRNQANTVLNFKGDEYMIDGNGVMRCSELVASMLLPTPGWTKYERNFESEIEAAKNRKLIAESAFRKAKEELTAADDLLAKLEREAAAERAAVTDKAPDPEPEEEPNESWTKDRLLSYAREYEVELPSGNPTKAEILTAIGEQLEDAE